MNPDSFRPENFQWSFAEGVATVTLDRPERKNPLTFDSYAELRDAFRALVQARAVKAVVLAGTGGNFQLSRDGGATFAHWQPEAYTGGVSAMAEADDGALIVAGEHGAARLQLPLK